MATYTSNDAINGETLDARSSNIREDLANVIFDISPTETPCVSAMRKTKASNVFHEWLTDSLAAPADNAAQFGSKPASATLTPRTRLGNYVQLLDAMVEVSDEQEMVDAASVQSELRYQTAKKLRELKRDLEYVVTALDRPANAYDPGTSTPARMRTIRNWIVTNEDTSGTARDFAETQLRSVITKCWEQGGSPNMVILNAAQQEIADGFVGTSTRYEDADSRRVHRAIDFYVTSLGEVQFMPSHFCGTGTVLVLDTSYWALAQLGALTTTPLARDGHTQKRMLSWYVTIEARNEASSGKISMLNQ